MGCVLYLDADRFYFSVEALERPELAADPRPIVIAHDPRRAPRAVVTTANDAARRLGIGSAQSALLALRRAPNALFLPPRHDLYATYSRRLMELLRQETHLVQQNSIDEAALAWEQHGFEPAPALRLRERIAREIGLSVSLGLAPSPLVGKMASEVAKGEPSHLRVVRPGQEPSFLEPMPIRALIGVGPKAEERLRAIGVTTIGDLQARDLGELVERFGQSYGRYLYRACRGEDDSALSDEREPKSISAERTFDHDTGDRRRLWQELQAQAEEVAARLRADQLVAGEVAIKVRYASWETFTRQMRLAQPTDRADALAAGAAALLRRHWERGRPIRLLGVRAARLARRPAAVQAPLPLDA
jgi:DNA polymerase-4